MPDDGPSSIPEQIRSLGSELERAFDTQLRIHGSDLPPPVHEHRWRGDRAWRFDRAWPDYRVAVDLEGGQYGLPLRCHQCGAVVRAKRADGSLGAPVRIGGYHARLSRYSADRERWNAALLDGWLLLTFLHEDIYGHPAETIDTIRCALRRRSWHAPTPGVRVTERERQVLLGFAAGLDGIEIARRIGLTKHTVRRHAQNICGKLGVHTRAAAVARAIAWSVISFDEVPWPDAEVPYPAGSQGTSSLRPDTLARPRVERSGP